MDPARFNARTLFMTNNIAVPDRASYRSALDSTIRAWALMTMQSGDPGVPQTASARVSYQSTTPPNPKQVQTRWACNIAGWTPQGVTLQVTNVF